MEGECRASECSLVCHDLHRLGYGRIIVDPGVQLAYDPHDAAGLHVEDVVRLLSPSPLPLSVHPSSELPWRGLGL